MSKIVTYAEFDLISVKTDGKTLEAVFFDKSTPNIKWPPKGGDAPHPDLMTALKDVTGSEIMATSLCLLEGWDFARENNRKNLEVLEDARRKWSEEVLRCEVMELHFTGEDETAGVQLKGKLNCDGAKIKIETPQYVFIEGEEELSQRAQEWAERVKKEVWSYLFKGKKSQTSLNLDEPANPDESEEGKQKPKGGLNVVHSA